MSEKDICLFQNGYEAGTICDKTCRFYDTCTRKHSRTWSDFWRKIFKES